MTSYESQESQEYTEEQRQSKDNRDGLLLMSNLRDIEDVQIPTHQRLSGSLSKGLSIKRKQTLMHKAIRMLQLHDASNDGQLSARIKKIETIIENDREERDELNRLQKVRWVRQRGKVTYQANRCCRSRQISQNDEDLNFVEELEAFNNQMYIDLEARKRAINNWRKLRTMVGLYRICGANLN